MDISHREFQIHVYNPSTHRSRCIPLPPNNQQQHPKDTAYPHHSPLLWSLAFDPRASSQPHHYKVILPISELGSWTAPALFNSQNHPKIWADGHWMGDWERSVFWNVCVHWIPHKYMGYYFDVVEKRLCMMPSSPLPPNLKEQISGDQHLYLVWSDGRSFVFTIHEMERDYSGWSTRFRVDLAPVSIACIGKSARIHILCVVEVEDECCLLLRLFPHKIIQYHLESQSFEQLNCPVADFAIHAFPFMENLAAV